ncbi:MAG: FMN-binding protein [Spirochaetes bacterium]|nr:FMN-binding protein [Spirochaetota bacterium]
MKKTIAITLMLCIVLAGASAQARLMDGIHFAQDKNFGPSGWKDMVTIVVQGGKIVSVEWDGVNLDATMFKKDWSKAGKYGLVKASRLGREWHEQAKAAEDYIVRTQDFAFSRFDKDGKTDAISGASLTVSGFFALAKQAATGDPVVRGKYKDGVWHAESAALSSSGWKGIVDVFVKQGIVVGASWNAVDKTGADRKSAVKAGKYTMKQGGTPWTAQANAVARYFIGIQDPSKVAYKDNAGHIDAVSGVSISVKEFFDLAAEALARAK